MKRTARIVSLFVIALGIMILTGFYNVPYIPVLIIMIVVSLVNYWHGFLSCSEK